MLGLFVESCRQTYPILKTPSPGLCFEFLEVSVPCGSTGLRAPNDIFDDIAQLHEFDKGARFPEVVDCRALLAGPLVKGRVGRGKYYNGRLGASAARPKVLQNLEAVTLGKMQVQQKQVWTWKFRVLIKAIDKRQSSLPVADDAHMAIDLVLPEGRAHKPNVRRVIFRQKNLAWVAWFTHIRGCRLKLLSWV